MDTIQEIATQLVKVFPDIAVYMEQEGNAPCFVIRQLSESSTQPATDRRQYTQGVSVLYYPASSTPQKECRDIGKQLFQILSCLNGQRGTGQKWEIKDNILHFYSTYKVTEKQPPSLVPLMEDLYRVTINKKG